MAGGTIILPRKAALFWLGAKEEAFSHYVQYFPVCLTVISAGTSSARKPICLLAVVLQELRFLAILGEDLEPGPFFHTWKRAVP